MKKKTKLLNNILNEYTVDIVSIDFQNYFEDIIEIDDVVISATEEPISLEEVIITKNNKDFVGIGIVETEYGADDNGSKENELKAESKEQKKHKLLVPCNSNGKQCFNQFSEDIRNEIHLNFWTMKYNERRQWIYSHVEKVDPAWRYHKSEEGKEACRKFTFVNIGPQTENCIPKVLNLTANKFLKNRNQCNFIVAHIDEEEVLDIMKSLDNKSTGPCSIPLKLLLLISDIIITPYVI